MKYTKTQNIVQKEDFSEKRMIFAVQPGASQSPGSSPREATELPAPTGQQQRREILRQESDLPSSAELRETTLPSTPPSGQEAQALVNQLRTQNLADRIKQMNLLSIKRKFDITRTDVDPAKWHTGSEAGLKIMYRDFGKLGLMEGISDKVFAVLHHGIGQTPDKQEYRNSEVYRASKEYTDYIKEQLILKWEADRLAIQAQKEGADSSSVTENVTNFVRRNLQGAVQAYRDGDWGKLALMIGAGVVAYKGISRVISSSNKGAKGLKYMAMAAVGVLGADVMMKNAGMRGLTEHLGISNILSSTSDTHLAALGKAIESSTDLNDKDKKLDGKVLAAISDIRLTTMEGLREGGRSRRFIDPRRFRQFRSMQRGSREWQRTGEEIYKISEALRVAYNETLFKNHSEYQEKDYNQAIYQPGLEGVNIRHFTAAIYPFIEAPPQLEATPPAQAGQQAQAQ